MHLKTTYYTHHFSPIMYCYKVLFAASISLLLLAPVLGQSNLKGRVQLPDSSAATMAIVKLLAVDSATLLSFTSTNMEGNWTLSNIKPGEYVLQTAFLGLETWARRITVTGSTDTFFFDIRLQELPMTLKVVEISSHRIGVVERGDTVQYDLSYYLDSTEYNLKDVLNRLPDMSVEGDGSIRYKGKRVNIALVEGRDLFGQLHKVMTEGIAAENVKGVQIIRAYKTGAEQEAAELSDKVAVNVQLTDEARQKFNGDAGFATDAHKFFEGNVTLYQTLPKWGYSFILRGNNTGNSTISGSDLIALMDFEEGTGTKGVLQGTSELVSPLLAPQPDAQSSLEILSALNIDASWNARWNSNLNVRYIQADRKMENVLFRLYIQDMAEFSGVRSRRYDSNIWQANLKNDYRGDGLWMKQRLALNINRLPVEANTNGVLAGNPFENRFFQNAGQLQLKAALEGGIGVDTHMMLIGRVKYEYFSKFDQIRLQSPSPLFNTGDSLLDQHNDMRDALLNTALSFRCMIGAQQLTTSLGYSHIAYSLEANTFAAQPAEQWNLEGRMNDAGMYGEIALGHKGKRRYRASAKINVLQRTFPTGPSAGYRYMPTEIRGGYYHDFSVLNSLYINAGFNTSPTPFVHLWRYNRIRNENTVYAEQLDSSFLQQEAFVNLIYRFTSQDNSYMLFLTQTAAIKKNEVLYQTIPNGNYLLYQSLLAPSVTQLSTSGRMGYRVKPIAITFNAIIMHEFKTGFAILSEQLLGVRNQNTDFTLSMSYEGLKRFNITIGHTYKHSVQRYEGQDAFQFPDNRTYTTASYRHHNWLANISASYHYQQFSSMSNQYMVLDFGVERRFTKPSLRIRLTGRNVLNLKGNPMIMPDFGANYTGLSRFQTIGGQVLAGIAYVF